MKNKRECIFCQAPLNECFGYVIPRDAIFLLEGEWDFETMGYPRELCQKLSCNKKWHEQLRTEDPKGNYQ